MWPRNLLLLGLCLAIVPAYQAIVMPPQVPRLRPQTRWRDNDSQSVADAVDAAFREVWQQSDVAPTPRAADLVIARRLSLALLGTVPSLEEIRQFEQQPVTERLDWWLRTILADRRSADYLAERLARAFVGTDDGPFLLFRRRRFVRWLADELSANRPYDELIRHLVADAGIWTDTPATNFITVAIKPDSDEDPDPSRLAARVARAFIGVRLDCAECHDHPFQPWKQRDFQGLAAFFAETRKTVAGIRDRTGEFTVENRKTGRSETIAPAVPYQPELLPTAGTRRQRLAAWLTNRDNKALARATVNRMWAILFGRALVTPIDNIVLGEAQPAALDLLADDFSSHGYDVRRLIRTIAATRVFQADSRGAVASGSPGSPPELAWAAFPITRLRPEQMVGSLLQAASLQTIDHESHILVQIARELREREFIKRFGDLGSDEFDERGGTVPQRLLLMNGQLVKDKTKDDLVGNAATRIAVLAPSDQLAIETATLAVLTRRPTAAENKYFLARLEGTSGTQRNERLEDLYWSLLNSTEFAWNH